MCKKAIATLTKDEKTLINHSVLKKFHNGDEVTIPRGKFKGKKGIVKLVYYNGGSEWANLEVYDEKKDKTYIVDAIDVYEFEKLKTKK